MTVTAELPIQGVDAAVDAKMHAVVKGCDRDGNAWKEVAEVTSVSSTGAGFYL